MSLLIQVFNLLLRVGPKGATFVSDTEVPSLYMFTCGKKKCFWLIDDSNYEVQKKQEWITCNTYTIVSPEWLLLFGDNNNKFFNHKTWEIINEINFESWSVGSVDNTLELYSEFNTHAIFNTKTGVLSPFQL